MQFILRCLNRVKCPTENDNKTNIVIPFNCKNIDFLQLSKIVRKNNVCKLLPESVKSIYPPKLYFKFDAPTAIKFCNYGKFLKNLSLQDVRDILSNDCICTIKHDFIYEPYGHIMTGNLSIVDDENLRSLFQYGAKHRIPRLHSWKQVVHDLKSAFLNHISSMARKMKINKDSFLPWFHEVFRLINKRISLLKTHKNNMSGSSAGTRSALHKLADLHDKFIITVVDKASSNFCFICKKFYVLTLLQELGIDLESFTPIGNVTYAPTSDLESEVVLRHCELVRNTFGITCPVVERKLPRIFWVPKLHKNPFGYRFIAGARKCTTKGLSKLLNFGLACVRDNFQRYCDTIYRNSDISCFWNVKSTPEFTQKMNKNKVFTL